MKENTARPVKRDFEDSWTREETLKVLEAALSAPAAKMDMPLIRELLWALEGEYDQSAQACAPKVWARIQGAIAPQKRSVVTRRTLVFALAAVLALALAAVGIAAAIQRGAFNFLNDFGLSQSPGTVQKEAYSLLQQNLAHASFDHVDVDVREAVYDGHELRIVYAVWDRDAAEHPTEEELYAPIIPAGWEDGLTCCDWIEIDGRDAYLNDAFSAKGERPGEALYYLQLNLTDQGFAPGDEMTIGLPMLQSAASPAEKIPEGLRFTISSAIPEGLVRKAKPASVTTAGVTATLTVGEFSPMSAQLRVTLSGGDPEEVDMDALAVLWSMAQLVSEDGEQLGYTWNSSLGRDETGVEIINLRATPPEKWPDTFYLAMPDIDGTPHPVQRILIALE